MSMIEKVEAIEDCIGHARRRLTTLKERIEGLSSEPLVEEEMLEECSDILGEVRLMARGLRQRDEELRDSKAELAAILESVPFVMMTVDQERRVRKINHSGAEFIGRPPEEMLGLRGGEALRCIHALDDPRGCGFGPACQSCVVRRTVLDTIKTGEGHQAVEADMAFSRERGEERRTLLVYTTPLTISGEQRVLVVLQDVTERKRAEEARERLLGQAERDRRHIEGLAETLKQERDTLRTIMESTHAQLAYLDADFNFIRVNTAYAEGAGYAKEELRGRGHFELFPNAENQAIFERVKGTGEPVMFRAKPFEHPNRPDAGTTYWDWSLIPVRDEDAEVQGLVLSLLDVTERERLMAQLNAERAKLDAIIQNAPVGIVVTDERARITLTNSAADRLFARPVPHGEDFESHAALELRRPDGTPYHTRDLPLTRSALDGERYSNLEMAILRPDGGQRDLLVDTAPIRDIQGRISGAVGIFRDITERRQTAEAMRRFNAQLQVMHEIDRSILAAQTAEEIADAILLHLRNLVPCQLASVEVFDLEAGEASVLGTRAKGEPPVEKGYRYSLARHQPMEDLQEGRPCTVEDIRTLSPNPLVETLRDAGMRSLASIPLKAQGKLIGCLSLARDEVGGLTHDELRLARDMADQLAIGLHQAQLRRKVRRQNERLEERVAQRTAKLRASEARFRAIFEQTAVGIALLDDRERVIASNPALQEMLGYGDRELAGRALTDFVHPDEDIEADLRTYRKMMAGERDYHRTETRYLDKDGETHWANIVLSLVRGSAGGPQFAIAMVEDVTERKKAQAAVIRSEKLATTGRIAASLAHEINNPLQTVTGCLGLTKESLAAGDGEDVKQYVEVAHEEVRRAARLVSRLRDLSRPTDFDAGEPTDVNGLIDRVLKLTQKGLRNQNIEADRHLAENLPRPVLVPDQIQQVFLNLMLNAIDAMPEGGQLKVSTGHDEASDEVVAAFADDGPGIPSDVLPDIFDPFFSTKSEGMGLGLFVSRNIVREHGGRIDVESETGEGCTFTVRLPVRAESNS